MPAKKKTTKKPSSKKPAKKSSGSSKAHAAKTKANIRAFEKKVDAVIKKHPESAAIISAAVGAALGATATILAQKKLKK